MSLADAQIAGICLAGQQALATGNITGFDKTPGLNMINPFR